MTDDAHSICRQAIAYCGTLTHQAGADTALAVAWHPDVQAALRALDAAVLSGPRDDPDTIERTKEAGRAVWAVIRATLPAVRGSETPVWEG